MAKNTDWKSGAEVREIMERFIERFPQMFEGFNLDKIFFVITEKAKAKTPLKVRAVGHPVEAFLDRPYIVEAFDEWWAKMDRKKRNQAVFGAMCRFPEGAYYVLADFSELSAEDSMTFGLRLTREAGVAPVPGGSFFSVPERGHSLARFVFCKRLETLHEAGDRLRSFAERG